MKRRRRSSLASRSANACSSRSSIALSAMPEAADLGARVGRLDAVGEVAAGDRARGVAHAVQRQQADAHDDPARRAPSSEQHAGDHERLDEQQPVAASGRRRAAGPPTTVDAAVRGSRCGEHAVARAGAVCAVDGERARRPATCRRAGRAWPSPCRRPRRARRAEHAAARRRAARRRCPAGGRSRAAAAAAAVRRGRRSRRPAPPVAWSSSRATSARSRRAACWSTRSSRNERCSAYVIPPSEQQPDGREREHGRDQPRAQRGHHVRGGRSA